MKNGALPEMKIFTGAAHPELAADIAAYLGQQLADATVTTFPDGESFVKINDNIRGRDIFIVQPTCPPTNQNIMELLIMVDAARRASADRITAVIPFFGYARQDRKDQPRVPITAKLVANLLVAAGVQRVLTMDLHAQQLQGFFDIPVDHLYALPVMVKHIRNMDFSKSLPLTPHSSPRSLSDSSPSEFSEKSHLTFSQEAQLSASATLKVNSDLVVVSPDVGGVKMASAYAEALGAGLAIVVKRRRNATEVEPLHVIGEVEGKNILIVDDITETAGTLVSAAKILRTLGVGDIYAGVSHAILTDLAIERLKDSEIKQLITTDSVPGRKHVEERVQRISIAGLLGEGMRRIHQGESVSSLFRVA